MLTDEEIAILRLRFVLKLSLRKVGTLLGMSYTRVWAISNRAMEKLAHANGERASDRDAAVCDTGCP